MTEYEKALEAIRLTPEQIEAEEAAERASNEQRPQLSKYGIMFWDYLKENHPARFALLVLEAELMDTCLSVDREALEMMDCLTAKLRKQTPRPDATLDFMATVRYETAIRDQAEGIVLNEIVYRPR